MDKIIYDRTATDVSLAKEIIENIIKNDREPNEEQLETLSRGTITLGTIQRIQKNQAELSKLFFDSFYFGEEVIKKEFSENDIFNDFDFQNIIENCHILAKRFFVYQTTPGDIKEQYTYESTNGIEKIIYDLNENYNFMLSSQKECDTFFCGED